MEERGRSGDWMEALETYTGTSIIGYQHKYLEDLLGIIMLTGFLVMFSQKCVIIRLIDADLRHSKPGRGLCMVDRSFDLLPWLLPR